MVTDGRTYFLIIVISDEALRDRVCYIVGELDLNVLIYEAEKSSPFTIIKLEPNQIRIKLDKFISEKFVVHKLCANRKIYNRLLKLYEMEMVLF